MGQDPAAKVRIELVPHEGRKLAGVGFDLGLESEPMRMQGLAKRHLFWLTARVRHWAVRRRVTDRSCGLRLHPRELSVWREKILLGPCPSFPGSAG
jgi:hypothetical protein